MRTSVTFLLAVLLIPAAAVVAAPADDESGFAASEQEPPPPPPPPEAQPARPPRPPGDLPGNAFPGRPPFPPRRMGPMGPDMPRPDPLLRMIRQRRPELAERLQNLRRKNPDLYHHVLLDALMFRLEDALNDAEQSGVVERERPRDGGRRGGRRDEGARPGRGRPPRPGVDRPRPPEPGPDADLRARAGELEERHGDLERETHELAMRLRDMRERGAAPPQQREQLRGELTRRVSEQFEVRTELRKIELERIERELHKLREMLERMQQQLQRREQQRESIIGRRIEQLLDDDMTQW